MTARSSLAALVIVSLVAMLVACDKEQNAAEQSDAAVPEEVQAERLAPEQRDEIVATLRDAEASADARLEAIHRAREARVDEAVPALVDLLEADDPDLAVAAAAALQALDARDAVTKIIDLAGRLSRAQQWEHLRTVLYVIGDFGGPRARTYLQTVAEGHQVPPIRQVAADILDGMR